MNSNSKPQNTLQSEIPWIGEIPSHWTIDRIKWSVKTCKNGVWGKVPESDEGIICVRVADFDRNKSKVDLSNPTFRAISDSERKGRLLHDGDLLLEKSGGGEKQPVGFVVLFDHSAEAICSNFIARMPIQEHQDPRFWNYVHQYLYSIRLNTKSIKQTTGIQNLDSYSYLSESFVYPPYGEQIMIANFLDEKTKQVDKAIANKERLITLLEEERISLISHAVMKGLDPNIPLVDSDIPWIGKFPKHWKLAKLKDLAKVELSNIDKKTKDNESQILLCNYVDVYYHELITNEIDFMEATAPNEKISKFSLKAGNVIITKDSETPDDIAVPAYVPETLPGVVCGYHLAQISPLQGVINGKYLFRSFQSSGIKNQFEIFAHGITRYGISKYDIKNSFFLVPPFTEQIKIADYIDKKCLLLDNSINNNRRQIKLLKEYRSAIISALVKGKI